MTIYRDFIKTFTISYISTLFFLTSYYKNKSYIVEKK